MRLIDADALKQRIMNNWYTATEIIDDIDSEPTADVAEVKHGKWEKMWHSYFKQELPCCSVCGHFSAMRWKYCPNCGADMRGGTDAQLD